MPSLFSRLNIFSSSNSKKKTRRKTANQTNDKRRQNKADDLKLVRRDEINLVERLVSGDSNVTLQTRNTTKSPNTSMNLSGLSSQRHHDPNGDDFSIPTMDSDYNHIQSGNFSLSDAGGTLGSQSQGLTNFSHAAGWMVNPATGMINDSVERRMYTDYYGTDAGLSSKPKSSSSTKEEMVELYAPAGILGLVIDAPATSTSPVVHVIKETCPIKHQVYVGDRLVAVDDIDVRGMSAVEVSRLISRKSGQDKRKLTIVRAARGRNGMY